MQPAECGLHTFWQGDTQFDHTKEETSHEELDQAIFDFLIDASGIDRLI